MLAHKLTTPCFLSLLFCLFFAGCASWYQTDYDARYGPQMTKERGLSWSEFQGRAQRGQVSFLKDVKPILDARCVVCHACNDAPCQLKLTSFEGIDRGASKSLVYDGARLTSAPPTRLFIDAKSTDEWRQKGFHPALNERSNIVDAELLGSLMFRVLNQKHINPLSEPGNNPQPLPDSFDVSISRSQQCPTIEEFDYFEQHNPLAGMPYGLPGLNSSEFSTIGRWLAEGAKFEPALPPSEQAQQSVNQWEAFLNQPSLKQQLVSRYLYEHLFLGHLYFKDHPPREFFRIVRSYTPTGEAIDEIPTVRPYDDPGTTQVYYRLKPVHSTIVDKTHLVYELSDERMARYQALFITPDYKVESLPSYEPKQASNPFSTFAAIPAKSKYKFLLDEAQFFIGGFIKGPVCRGQIALNVIDDHFWTLFLDPETDPLSQDSAFLTQQAKNLQLPAASEDTLRPSRIWFKYANAQKRYRKAKNQYLDQQYNGGLESSLNSLWNGSGSYRDRLNDNAALTIFRHYDSATVVKGFVGSEPKTVWVLDYPLFERIHYLLVAGFNVYGNLGHQLSTRLYMDYLRMESENNFLNFLPIDQRKPTRDSWYQGVGAEIVNYFDNPLTGTERETRISFQSQEVKSELLALVENHLSGLPLTDPLNRCQQANCAPSEASAFERRIQPALRQLARITGTRLSIIPDLAYLKIASANAAEQAMSYSLVHNRAHTNISFIIGEDASLAPEKDTLTLVRGFIGSYPNFYFHVQEEALPDFIQQLTNMDTAEDEERFIQAYGVRRTDPEFWQFNDWFNSDYRQLAPVQAGWFDLNRYENR